ncbi:MAG: hypothetical protein ACYDD1_02270 [Caulobacteraceae bacterium]
MLARRKIDLTFQLGKGSYGNSGFNTVTLTGRRVSATISKAGGVGLSTLDMQIYGLTLDQINQLTTLGQKLVVYGMNNIVTVSVGDDSGTSVAFSGIIQQSWADASGMPEVALSVSAVTGLVDALAPAPPISLSGSVDVAQLMGQLATQMGRSLENSGVNVKLPGVYLHGSALDQARAVAKAANIQMLLEGEQGETGSANGLGILAIWPTGGARGGAVPLIAPPGLIGYPTFTANGLSLQTLYNPAIQFGANVQVQSAFTPACGTWTTLNVNHQLEAETPGGKWFTGLECYRAGTIAPVETST